jgi:hypothetical protein
MHSYLRIVGVALVSLSTISALAQEGNGGAPGGGTIGTIGGGFFGAPFPAPTSNEVGGTNSSLESLQPVPGYGGFGLGAGNYPGMGFPLLGPSMQADFEDYQTRQEIDAQERRLQDLRDRPTTAPKVLPLKDLGIGSKIVPTRDLYLPKDENGPSIRDRNGVAAKEDPYGILSNGRSALAFGFETTEKGATIQHWCVITYRATSEVQVVRPNPTRPWEVSTSPGVIPGSIYVRFQVESPIDGATCYNASNLPKVPAPVPTVLDLELALSQLSEIYTQAPGSKPTVLPSPPASTVTTQMPPTIIIAQGGPSISSQSIFSNAKLDLPSTTTSPGNSGKSGAGAAD